MALQDYLDGTADLHTGGETLDPATRLPVTDPTADTAGVSVRMVHRSAASTVYDDSGTVLTDYDCLTDYAGGVTEGDVIDVTAGPVTGRFVVTGEAVVGRGRSGSTVRHLTIPCTRIA